MVSLRDIGIILSGAGASVGESLQQQQFQKQKSQQDLLNDLARMTIAQKLRGSDPLDKQKADLLKAQIEFTKRRSQNVGVSEPGQKQVFLNEFIKSKLDQRALPSVGPLTPEEEGGKLRVKSLEKILFGDVFGPQKKANLQELQKRRDLIIKNSDADLTYEQIREQYPELSVLDQQIDALLSMNG